MKLLIFFILSYIVLSCNKDIQPRIIVKENISYQLKIDKIYSLLGPDLIESNDVIILFKDSNIVFGSTYNFISKFWVRSYLDSIRKDKGNFFESNLFYKNKFVDDYYILRFLLKKGVFIIYNGKYLNKIRLLRYIEAFPPKNYHLERILYRNKVLLEFTYTLS